MDANKQQLEMPLIGCINAAGFLDDALIAKCETSRDAVMLCWMYRRRKCMTERTLAEEIGSPASHVTGFVSSVAKLKRELPLSKVAAFEASCGNRAITQWYSRQANVTLMEEVISRRAA